MGINYSPILKGVLSAAASALNEEGRPPGRVELTPGLLPAWDDCCNGQLYLRVIEIYPTLGSGSGPFPQIDATQRGVGETCGIQMVAVHIGLGILRCVKTIDTQADEPVAPTSEEVTSDADLMLMDMSTLFDALVCQSQTIAGVKKLKMDRWNPLGADGGCAGGEWGAYLAIDPCLCNGLP